MKSTLNYYIEKKKKWDLRFLRIAEEVATWSKDPSTKVGAVITYGNEFVSLGYNGLPKRYPIEFEEETLADRDLKYKTIIHGEMNAITFANRKLIGCTLYTVPFLPCSVCASRIIQEGIDRVISYENKVERWQESIEISKDLFKKCGVSVVEYENQIR